MSEKYFARMPFTYAHQPLDRGELVNLKGSPRDNQLVGFSYLVIVDPSIHGRHLCLNCGRAFVTMAFLEGHKRKPGGCLAKTQEISRDETASLLGIDAGKVQELGNPALLKTGDIDRPGEEG